MSNIDNLQANQLTTKMRLLHHIVSRIFFPKMERFDWVTAKDVVVMYYLIQERPMNLPYM